MILLKACYRNYFGILVSQKIVVWQWSYWIRYSINIRYKRLAVNFSSYRALLIDIRHNGLMVDFSPYLPLLIDIGLERDFSARIWYFIVIQCDSNFIVVKLIGFWRGLWTYDTTKNPKSIGVGDFCDN